MAKSVVNRFPQFERLGTADAVIGKGTDMWFNYWQSYRTRTIAVGIFLLIVVAFYTIPNYPVCTVHHTHMKNYLLIIRYGLVHRSPAFRQYVKAATTQFPNANTVALGGCLWMPWDFARPVVYCEDCRSALRVWTRQHGDPWHPARR